MGTAQADDHERRDADAGASRARHADAPQRPQPERDAEDRARPSARPPRSPTPARAARSSAAAPGDDGVGEQGQAGRLAGQGDVRVGHLAVAPEADGRDQQQAGQQARRRGRTAPAPRAIVQATATALQRMPSRTSDRLASWTTRSIDPGEEHVQRVARRVRLVEGDVVEVAHGQGVVGRVERVQRRGHERQPRQHRRRHQRRRPPAGTADRPARADRRRGASRCALARRSPAGARRIGARRRELSDR